MFEDASSDGPIRFSLKRPDGAVAGWRWVNEGAPPLLFCHATGFCASVYKRMLQPLSDRFDIFALDMRGHGRTSLPADPGTLRSWDIYADDVASFLNSEARDGWTLSGHSMGGVVVAMASRGRKDVSAIRLIEPVAMPPATALLARTPIWPHIAQRFPLVRGARQRRSVWPARGDVMASYDRKKIFRSWAPGVLADYLEDGLVDADGGVRLSCAPAWEAATFQAHANDFWGAVRAAPAPIRVLAADDRSSTVWPGALRRFRRAGGQVAKQPGASHLIAMEKPDFVAEFVAAE